MEPAARVVRQGARLTEEAIDAATDHKPGYQSALELGRVPMTLGKAAKPVEQLTISVDETPQGGTLRVEWGTVRATASFTIG